MRLSAYSCWQARSWPSLSDAERSDHQPGGYERSRDHRQSGWAGAGRGRRHVVYRTNPFANDPVALQDGRRLFNWYNCSGCHGGHAGGGMGPSLRDPVWLYGNRDDQIFDTIAHGRSNGMPAWGSKIPQNQIWELVAYIKSMGTPMEPEPPIEPADEKVANPQQEYNARQGDTNPLAGRR